MPRARTAIAWSPSWNDDVQRWTAAFLHNSVWRCDHIHGVDDLMQDAYLLFHKVSERYPRVITQAAFMKLYKASLRNMLHDHARVMMLKRECFADECDDTEADLLVGDTTNMGEFIHLLNDLPHTIVDALNMIAEHPELLRANGGVRENLNQKLRRLLNVGREFEFIRSLRTLLQES